MKIQWKIVRDYDGNLPFRIDLSCEGINISEWIEDPDKDGGAGIEPVLKSLRSRMKKLLEMRV